MKLTQTLTIAVIFAILLVSKQGLAQQSGGGLTAEAQRTAQGRVGLDLLNKDTAGRAFLAACRKSAAVDAQAFAGFSGATGLPPDVIGGYCACTAGSFFSRQQSPLYGRMQAITRRAAGTQAGSIVLAAVEDAKANGGMAQGAFAVGFVTEVVGTCKTSHLDLKARAAAERAKETEREFQALVQGQALSTGYVTKVEQVAARYSGATVVACSAPNEWPNVSDSMFVLDTARARSDVFDGWVNPEVFDRFIKAAKEEKTDTISKALPDLEASARAVDGGSFSEPYKLVTEGDFYRLPIFDSGREVGYYCLSRAERGVSYFAGYPLGGKTMGKVNSFLNALSGSQDLPSTECTANVNTRQFRENGGALLQECRVVARGTEAEAYIRGALLDSGKRTKAAPDLLRRMLDDRAAEHQSSLRF